MLRVSRRTHNVVSVRVAAVSDIIYCTWVILRKTALDCACKQRKHFLENRYRKWIVEDTSNAPKECDIILDVPDDQHRAALRLKQVRRH